MRRHRLPRGPFLLPKTRLNRSERAKRKTEARPMSNGQNERREMTGAEMVVQALIDNGVKHVFGYPGGAVLPIYDELFQQDQLHHVLVRHEQGAGHAAEGYARSTGKAGVMLVTSGPGATNAVTPLQD